MKIIPQPMKFEWDSGNYDKSYKKHGIRNEEAEEVFQNVPAVLLADEKHSKKERRYMLLGKSDNSKFLSVIFTFRGQKVRIVSARSMSRKERRLYEEKNKANS